MTILIIVWLLMGIVSAIIYLKNEHNTRDLYLFDFLIASVMSLLGLFILIACLIVYGYGGNWIVIKKKGS